MKQRKYFDILAWVGRKSNPMQFPIKIEDLLADMKYARVHGAAIASNVAIDYSFFKGNGEIQETIAKEERLVGIGVVPTTALFEVKDPLYFEKLFDSGIRALLVDPVALYSNLDPEDMREIAEALIGRGFPLIIPNVIPVDRYNQIRTLAKAYPVLNIIVAGSHWECNRYLFKVMEQCPNVYMEYSGNQANHLLEHIRDLFGIERVLYSGGWPRRDIGALKSQIEYAKLTEEEKDMVAYGNACRLLKISIDDFALYDEADCAFDEIAKEVDAGLPVSVPVIDAHTHLVHEDHRAVSNIMMLDSDGDSMIEMMDRMGVDTMVTSVWDGLSTGGVEGNETGLRMAKKYPGRILVYNTCNIHYEEDQKGWKKYFDDNPEIFVGEKPYWPYQQFALTDPKCDAWFAYANEHRLPILIHTGAGNATKEVGELSEKYPDATFLLAHSGCSYAVAEENGKLALERDNVVLEITYTSVTRGLIRYMVDKVGADKVLFGTDTPMRDAAAQLGWVAYADISVEDKKKILAGNIKRILERIR